MESLIFNSRSIVSSILDSIGVVSLLLWLYCKFSLKMLEVGLEFDLSLKSPPELAGFPLVGLFDRKSSLVSLGIEVDAGL